MSCTSPGGICRARSRGAKPTPFLVKHPNTVCRELTHAQPLRALIFFTHRARKSHPPNRYYALHVGRMHAHSRHTRKRKRTRTSNYISHLDRSTAATAVSVDRRRAVHIDRTEKQKIIKITTRHKIAHNMPVYKCVCV